MTQDTYIKINIDGDVEGKLAGESSAGETWNPIYRHTALFKGDKKSIGDVFIRYNGTVDGCIDITFGIEKQVIEYD